MRCAVLFIRKQDIKILQIFFDQEFTEIGKVADLSKTMVLFKSSLEF